MIVAFTGHRPNKLNNEYAGKGPISDYIRSEIRSTLLRLQPAVVVVGMALGVDMLAAEVAIELGIPVIPYIPFVGQESKWPYLSQLRYRHILSQSLAPVIVSGGGYAPWKMQWRNKAMCDRSHILIAVWDGSPGGTANCVKYGKTVCQDIIYINPKPID